MGKTEHTLSNFADDAKLRNGRRVCCHPEGDGKAGELGKQDKGN